MIIFLEKFSISEKSIFFRKFLISFLSLILKIFKTFKKSIKSIWFWCFRKILNKFKFNWQSPKSLKYLSKAFVKALLIISGRFFFYLKIIKFTMGWRIYWSLIYQSSMKQNPYWNSSRRSVNNKHLGLDFFYFFIFSQYSIMI